MPWNWLYLSIGAGKVLAGSMPSFFRNGFRSAQTLAEQNLPTLSVVNEETTSGASSPPARRACSLFSSSIFGTIFTWMFGCAFWKAATLSSMALVSLSWFQPCQKVMVTSLPAAESSWPPEELVPVQAVASRARTALPVTAASRRDDLRTECISESSWDCGGRRNRTGGGRATG